MAKQKIIPQNIKKLAKKLENDTGLDNFVICGGILINLLLSKKINYRDIDINIKGLNKKKINECKKHLTRNGYKIIQEPRKYIIYKNKRAILMQANKDNLKLDLAFLKNPESVGHYNIDTLCLKYPSFELIDNHKSLEGVKTKNIQLIINKNNEDPFILFSRLIYLCSKYNISLSSKKTKSIINEINYNISKGKNTKEYRSLISSIFRTISYSKHKSKLVKQIFRSKILIKIFPELNNSLEVISQSKILLKKLEKIDSVEYLILFFGRNLIENDIKSFAKIIYSLKKRVWDNKDYEKISKRLLTTSE
jgi:hypothetical protein